jgi:hypothetical protein
MKVLLIVALAGVLTGCGGGGTLPVTHPAIRTPLNPGPTNTNAP